MVLLFIVIINDLFAKTHVINKVPYNSIIPAFFVILNIEIILLNKGSALVLTVKDQVHNVIVAKDTNIINTWYDNDKYSCLSFFFY